MEEDSCNSGDALKTLRDTTSKSTLQEPTTTSMKKQKQSDFTILLIELNRFEYR